MTALLERVALPMDGVPGVAETFGERLKRLREQAGLTQEQLGTSAGMHKMSIAKLEQDQHSPTWPTVQAIAKALGLTVMAFDGTVEPAEGEKKPARMGRPPKEKPAEQASEPEPEQKPARKRKRGE